MTWSIVDLYLLTYMTSVDHNDLTHWGRVTHICVGKLSIIGSDNGLSPGRRQAIIWTNAEILLIGSLGTNFSESLIEILTFSFKKMRLKISSAKWRPFCLGLNVLTHCLLIMQWSVHILLSFFFLDNGLSAIQVEVIISADPYKHTQIAKFMGPIWGPPGSCRPQMGPMLAPQILLSAYLFPGCTWRSPFFYLL